MKKKISYVGIFSLLIFVFVFLCEWSGEFIYCNKLSRDFAKKIEAENVDDLSLTIYMHPEGVIVDPPIGTVEKLIKLVEEEKDCGENKIIISGDEIIKHMDIYKNMKNEPVIPVIKKCDVPWIDLYYVFESKKNGKLMDVSMWGVTIDSSGCRSYSIFVNGIEVLENRVFSDIIMPYVSDDVNEWLIKELQD